MTLDLDRRKGSQHFVALKRKKACQAHEEASEGSDELRVATTSIATHSHTHKHTSTA